MLIKVAIFAIATVSLVVGAIAGVGQEQHNHRGPM
jgi:hypothetical protein